MRILFVTESLRGNLKRIPEGIKEYSLAVEHSTVPLNEESSGFKNIHKSILNTKTDYVILGTDLDSQGTKVASLWKYQTDGSSKVIRMSATNKGYVNIGGYYEPERMKSILKSDILNKKTYERLSKEGIYTGYKTATVIGKIANAVKQKIKEFPVKKGTNTITYLTKSALKGQKVQDAYEELINNYHSGKISYPRVDNDYHQDDAYDLFAHPKLEMLDERYEEFKEDTLPLNKNTVLLYLSNERLITPATAIYYYKKIDEYFDDDLNIKKGKEQEVEVLSKISKVFETELREELKMEHFPKLDRIMVRAPSLFTKSSKKEDLEEELLRLYEKQMELKREEYLKKVREMERLREETFLRKTEEASEYKDKKVFDAIKNAYLDMGY